MPELKLLAFDAWGKSSTEGMLVADAAGNIRMINPRLLELLKLQTAPHTITDLLSQVGGAMPELRAVISAAVEKRQTQWGNLRIQHHHPPLRLIWQMIPLLEDDAQTGALIIFRDVSAEGQLELAKQSFLSMISHDLRTPLSTILGFAELLRVSQGNLTSGDQMEFLGHIIQNANELSRYIQIALDIMYLEANLQNFEFETVFLARLLKYWLRDAAHRFPVDQVVLRNGLAEEPSTKVAPAAMHRILTILLEFALAESSPGGSVDIRLDYDSALAHVVVAHDAPNLKSEDAALLFQLMHSRDLSETGRPRLHRMQLYVASLLAERQAGYLTLRGGEAKRYELDLAVPLASNP